MLTVLFQVITIVICIWFSFLNLFCSLEKRTIRADWLRKWLHGYFLCKDLHYKIIIAVFLAKISPKQDFMVNHAYFFYFVTWISLIFLMVSGVFTDIYCEQKLENLGWYSWNQTKNSWNSGVGFRAGGLSIGAGRGRHREIHSQSFNFFFCLVSWNHQRFQFSLPINIRETPEIMKKSVKPGHKK